MKEKELRQICEKYGYHLDKITRFKNHDRVKVVYPKAVLTLNLRKHLEETPTNGLLRSILNEEQLKLEGIA